MHSDFAENKGGGVFYRRQHTEIANPEPVRLNTAPACG
ncbi:hypothetical protein NLA_20530 [Neisseria lactamica 020-06]|uniref:Uncharacterized protein n=1 Tax=Neisseria lactamica (strain 020-06) TaxID=489653 RepID=E4ZAT1_NEIL0|nr:hypothetical protein NLA_20530 [Neisseria lactamica 020-06]